MRRSPSSCLRLASDIAALAYCSACLPVYRKELQHTWQKFRVCSMAGLEPCRACSKGERPHQQRDGRACSMRGTSIRSLQLYVHASRDLCPMVADEVSRLSRRPCRGTRPPGPLRPVRRAPLQPHRRPLSTMQDCSSYHLYMRSTGIQGTYHISCLVFHFPNPSA